MSYVIGRARGCVYDCLDVGAKQEVGQEDGLRTPFDVVLRLSVCYSSILTLSTEYIWLEHN